MARYIDADKLCEDLKSMASVQPPLKQSTILGVVSSIKNFPTADVVPKSEYDWVVSAVDNSTKEFLKLHDDFQKVKREVDRLKYNLKAVLEEIPETKAEVAREIFEEIERMCIDTFGNFNHKVFAELKKKYTEGEDEEG